MKPIKSLLVVALVIVIMIAGCSTPPGRKGNPYIPGTEGQKEVRVQVLDATTMEPIAGAIVVGGYYGFTNVGGNRGVDCGRSESAVSDESGWATLPNDQDPRIGERGYWGPYLVSAYKRGYQLAKPAYRARWNGKNNKIEKMKPKPLMDPVETDDVISSEVFPGNQKAGLMKSKELQRIYMMPSTAKTKEERERELSTISRPCLFRMPFEFSESEGMLVIWGAIYQEKLDAGFTGGSLEYSKDMLDEVGKSYLEFRHRTNKEKLQ
jgi:hypothetical protein